jgi:hypothetical protein
LVGAAVLLVACGGGGAESTGPHPTHGHDDRHRALGGQLSAREALARPPLPPGEGRAVRDLARGAPATATEIDAVMRSMEVEGPAPDVEPSTADARARLAAELAGARAATDRFPTARDARDAGYVLASRALPGIGAHWVRWSQVDEPFDASRPAMLLYDGNGLDAPIAGLSYFVRSPATPTGFTDGGAVWHQHAGLCIVRGALVAESVARPQDCAGGRGHVLPGRDLWMLHVWPLATAPNPWGTFAPLNPALCPSRASCFPTP